MDESINSISFRTASGIADYWRVREFLLGLWGLVPPGEVWEVRRWDGSYFHCAEAGWGPQWRGGAAIGIWETPADATALPADGAAPPRRIVAVVHPEDGGDAWLEVHPAWRHLEDGILAWAEAELAETGADGVRRLFVAAGALDTLRRELLARRGYTQLRRGQVLRRYAGPVPDAPVALPAGYRLHTLRPGDPEDCARYAALLNDGFRRTIHSAQEVATFTTHSPSFDAGLELVAAAPDGSFAALAGLVYDAHNRFGLFEPVCATHNPRPLGLAGLLMREGVRRVLARGAQAVYVGTGKGMAANRFYDAVGFEIIHRMDLWEKLL